MIIASSIHDTVSAIEIIQIISNSDHYNHKKFICPHFALHSKIGYDRFCYELAMDICHGLQPTSFRG